MTIYYTFGDVDRKFAESVAEKNRKTGKGFLAKIKGEKPEEIKYIEKYYIPVQVWNVSYPTIKGILKRRVEQVTRRIYIIPTNPNLDVRDMIVDFNKLTRNYGQPDKAEEIEEERILPANFDFLLDFFSSLMSETEDQLLDLTNRVNSAIENCRDAYDRAKLDIEDAWRYYHSYRQERDPSLKDMYLADCKAALKSVASTLEPYLKEYENSLNQLKDFIKNLRRLLGEVFGGDAEKLIDLKEPQTYKVDLPSVVSLTELFLGISPTVLRIPISSIEVINNLDSLSIDRLDEEYLIPIYIVNYVSEKGERYIVVSRSGRDKFLEKFTVNLPSLS